METHTTTKKPKASIFTLLKPYRGMIIILVLLALAGNALTLILPKVISHGIDSFVHGTFAYNKTIVDFSLLAIGIIFFTVLQNIVQTHTSEKAARDLRTKLAAKISRGSYLFIQKTNPSKLLTHLTSDVDSIKMFVAQAVKDWFFE
jgi:ATP-binding cassette subfamily B protein